MPGEGICRVTATTGTLTGQNLTCPTMELRLDGKVAVVTGASRGIGKGIAKAYGQEGVRANCVAPGAIETASLTALRRHVSETKGIPYNEALERVMVDEWHLDIALQRPGRATEVGNLIAFVLSDLAAYMTGTLINIDGGTNF